MATFKFNRDVSPGEDFLKAYPDIAPLLDETIGGEEFKTHDKAAKRAKFWWLLLGRISLALSILAVLGIVGELAAYAWHVKPPLALTVVIELLAAAAVLTLVIDRFFMDNKEEYLYHCYCRERLRHFRFQTFLDGALLSGLAHQNNTVVADVKARLQELLLNFESGHGAVKAYIDGATGVDTLLHKRSEYTDPAVESRVFKALKPLRFEYQTQYPRIRTASISEHYSWAEMVGKLALLAAVALPLLQLGVIGLAKLGLCERSSSLTLALFVASVAAAVISAGARAYCVGMTLPDETDSYHHYAAHVDALGRMLARSATTPTERLDLLLELELEAERELRRFLTMKSKATFVA